MTGMRRDRGIESDDEIQVTEITSEEAHKPRPTKKSLLYNSLIDRALNSQKGAIEISLKDQTRSPKSLYMSLYRTARIRNLLDQLDISSDDVFKRVIISKKIDTSKREQDPDYKTDPTDVREEPSEEDPYVYST